VEGKVKVAGIVDMSHPYKSTPQNATRHVVAVRIFLILFQKWNFAHVAGTLAEPSTEPKTDLFQKFCSRRSDATKLAQPCWKMGAKYNLGRNFPRNLLARPDPIRARKILPRNRTLLSLKAPKLFLLENKSMAFVP